MENTWLVQRLRKPSITVPFSFGGGLVNGGISDRGMKLLEGIWDFDYMGAAEFEWGLVPEALNKIAGYRRRKFFIGRKNYYTGNISLQRNINYLCEMGTERNVETVIINIASKSHKLKEPAFLDKVLEGNENYDKYGGWLELDNAFMFFTDNEMYSKTLRLFGMK